MNRLKEKETRRTFSGSFFAGGGARFQSSYVLRDMLYLLLEGFRIFVCGVQFTVQYTNSTVANHEHVLITGRSR